MFVEHLTLTNFRNYEEADVSFTHGTTALLGANGQGKTSLAEALTYLATLDSFRGVPAETLIRNGADTAILRATVKHPDGRELLIEVELSRTGRNKAQVNKQRLVRNRDLLGVLRTTIFSPDDLALIKDGPSERRRFIDDALVAIAVKHDATRRDVERIVKQRNALLKQIGYRSSVSQLSSEQVVTLDVWDEKFAIAGGAHPAPGTKAGLDVTPDLGVLHQRCVEGCGDGFRGEVVGGGAQAAGGDQQPATAGGFAHSRYDPPTVVAHHLLAVVGNAQSGELLSNPAGVAVGDVAQ